MDDQKNLTDKDSDFPKKDLETSSDEKNEFIIESNSASAAATESSYTKTSESPKEINKQRVKTKQTAEVKNQDESIVERIEKLMELVKVKKVYYIDDANCKNVDVEVFLGKINSCYSQPNPEEKLNKILIEGVVYSEPYDIVSTIIKEKWSKISSNEKLRLLKELNEAIDDANATQDYFIVPKIKDYFPEGFLEYVDPFEWEKIEKDLGSDIEDDSKVLLIFDQILKDAGGKFVLRTGIDLIIDIKNTSLKNKAICALLTNEILSPDLELYYRKQIVDEKERSLEDWDFFPLSKQRLDVPEVFADGIKKTLINKPFEIIKHETINIVRKSHEEAFDKVRKLNTYIFDDAVIKSSYAEGVWEVQTLLRIIEIYQKDELYQAMIDDNYCSKVNPEIKFALKFSDTKFEIPYDYKPYTDKAKIRHRELYQSSDLINNLHKPIENGDIFQIDEMMFILVAQPCDMMVRSSGAKNGRRNAKYVNLLKIINISNDEFSKKKKKDSLDNYLTNKHAMLYLNEQGADVAIALFSETITVDVDILDLIVYNKEGKCVYDFINNKFDLNEYNTAWEKRFNYIKDNLQKLKERIDISLTKVKDDTQDRSDYIEENFYPKLIVNSTSNESIKVSYENEAFDFNIKRILNYKSSNAAYLLDRYTRYLSRTAELHDFAQ